MSDFVLDNSVCMRWCLDVPSAYAEGILDRLLAGDSAHAPLMWLYEVVSVLAKYQQKGTLTKDKADGFLEDLQSLDMRVDPDGIEPIFGDV